MSTVMNFRAAFNGFNREDVVKFIEYLNTKHSSELAQLANENDELRAKLSAAQSSCGQELEKLLEEQKKRNQQLEEDLRRQQERCAALEKQLEEAGRTRGSVMSQQAEQELEAYRRAERTERIAKERAAQVYCKANVALTGAAQKADDAFAMIGDLSDQVTSQLARLQSAITGSKQALADACDTLGTIRPDNETC